MRNKELFINNMCITFSSLVTIIMISTMITITPVGYSI